MFQESEDKWPTLEVGLQEHSIVGFLKSEILELQGFLKELEITTQLQNANVK